MEEWFSNSFHVPSVLNESTISYHWQDKLTRNGPKIARNDLSLRTEILKLTRSGYFITQSGRLHKLRTMMYASPKWSSLEGQDSDLGDVKFPNAQHWQFGSEPCSKQILNLRSFASDSAILQPASVNIKIAIIGHMLVTSAGSIIQ